MSEPSLSVSTFDSLSSARQSSDGDLLERFLVQRDEGAFALLVERHGAMVRGVSRRVLRDEHQAEDVFQATFLLLASKGESIRERTSLGCWLHGVAYRIAGDAVRRARRALRPDTRPASSTSPPTEEVSWREVQQILDEELLRLPEKYRQPLVLCYLEGLTRDEAATQLGLSEQQVKGRLERGRDQLRASLVRRGVTLSATLLTTMLTQQATSAATSAGVSALSKAAVGLASGASLASLGVERTVVALVERGVDAMSWKLWKSVLALVVLLGGVGVWLTAGQDKINPNNPDSPGDKKALPIATPLPDRDKPMWDRPVTFRTVRSDWTRLAFSPDGKELFVTKPDRLYRWDTATAKSLPSRKTTGLYVGLGKNGVPLTVVFEKAPLGPGPQGPPVQWFRVREATTDRTVVKGILQHAKIYQAAISPDHRRLAFISVKEVYLFDATTGQPLYSKSISRAPVHTLAFSPDGKTLAVGWGTGYPVGGHVNGGIDLIDAKSGALLRTLENAPSQINTLAFSPDGKTIAGSGVHGKSVALWDPATGKRRVTLDYGKQTWQFFSLTFSPDGKTLYANTRSAPHSGAIECGVVGWEVTTGRQLTRVGGLVEMIQSVAVSPDGRFLVATDTRGNVSVWRNPK